MFRLAIISLAITVLLSGCAQAAQKAVEQSTGVQTSQKGDTVTITGKDGEKLVVSSNAPDEIKGFPVPQGFKLDSSGSMTQGADKLTVASWKGKSTFQAVQEFYQKTMPGQGWKEEAVFTTDTGSLLNYSKGEENAVTITTSKEGDDISISVMLGKSSRKPGSSGGASGSTAAGAATGGGSASATPAAARAAVEATPTASKPEPTATPAAPKTTDASALPDELKQLPVPGGFSVVQGSTARVAEGGKFGSAVARWFGKASVKEVGDFYQKNLPGRGWQEDHRLQLIRFRRLVDWFKAAVGARLGRFRAP